jgi:hypothetical protein
MSEAFEKAWNKVGLQVGGLDKKASAKLMWDAATAHQHEPMECGHPRGCLARRATGSLSQSKRLKAMGVETYCLTCEAIAAAYL